MSLPYPPPEPIKTTRRCQYSLPGFRYNCRRLGKFILNGKGYCGPHFDATWKARNPIFGQQHNWHIRINKFTGAPWPYPTCRVCGAIKMHDGLAQEPCTGHMPRIVLE